MITHNLAILAIFAVVVLAILRTFTHRRETSWLSASRLLMGISLIVVVMALRRGTFSLYALALISAVWGVTHCFSVLAKKKVPSPARLRSKEIGPS